MYELKHFSARSIWECGGWCREGSRKSALKTYYKDVVLISPVLGARSGRPYLPPFRTEGAPLQKIVLKKMGTKI